MQLGTGFFGDRDFLGLGIRASKPSPNSRQAAEEDRQGKAECEAAPIDYVDHSSYDKVSGKKYADETDHRIDQDADQPGELFT